MRDRKEVLAEATSLVVDIVLIVVVAVNGSVVVVSIPGIVIWIV